MPKKSKLRIGDVVLISAGKPIGAEILKTRPWAIVAIPTKTEESNRRIGIIIAVPMSSVDKKWYTNVRIADNSYAICHLVRAMSPKRIQKTLDRLNEKTMIKIRSVISNLVFHPDYI